MRGGRVWRVVEVADYDEVVFAFRLALVVDLGDAGRLPEAAFV